MSISKDITKSEAKMIMAILVLVLTLISIVPTASAALWWDTTWQYRKDINITNVGSTALTDFPAYLNISKEAGMLSNYTDLRFIYGSCEANGSTILPYELENYTATTAHAWVRIPSLTTGTNIICMYYGNPSATDSQNRTEVWNANYVGVWHMSETGTGIRADSTQNAHSATPTNYDGDEKITGAIDGADDLDGAATAGDYLQTTSAESLTADNLTWEVWFKADAIAISHLLWEGEGGGNGFGVNGEMHISIGQYAGAVTDQILSFFLGTDEPPGTGQMLFINMTFNDITNTYYAAFEVANLSTAPSARAYLDGTLIGTDTGTTAGVSRSDWNTNLRIGRPGTDNRYFSGMIDEIRISTASRSQDWINQTYQVMSNQADVVAAGAEENMTGPTIEFNTSTTAAGMHSQDWISANITAASQYFANITINLYNGSESQLNATTSSSSPYYVTFAGLADGTYYLNATSYDTRGFYNWTGTRTIILDTTSPSNEYSSGAAPDGSSFARDWIYADISASDQYEQNVTFRLYNASQAINITTLGAGNRSINWTGLHTNSKYWYNVTVTDQAGNFNTTATRNITLDTVNPEIDYDSETTSEGAHSQSWIDVFLTAIDNFFQSIQTFLYNSAGGLVNSTNSTSPTVSVNYTSLSDGTYYLNATANDTAGNSNWTATRTILLDTINPNITFGDGTEENGSFRSRSWIYVDINASDANEENLTFRLYNASFSTLNATTLGAGNRSINWTGLDSNMEYWYNATITDRAGNTNQTETRKITLDSTSPGIAFESQTTTAGFKVQNWIYVNLTVNETNKNNVTISLFNASGSILNYSTSTNATMPVNFTGLPDGKYYLNATANDTAGNKNSTETRNITLDRTNPSINYSTGTENNGTFFARNWICVNLTANDTNEANITFRLYNSTYGQLNATTLGPGNRSINWTGLGEGTYSYNTTIYDLAGLSNSTTSRTISLDGSNPSINYSTGTEDNNTYFNKSWIYVNLTAYDLNEANVTFRLYNSTYGQLNATTLGPGNRSINWTSLNSNAIYWYNATITDAVNNQNTTETRKITLDSTTPTISFGAGTENSSTFFARDWIYLNLSANDANEENITFTLYNSTLQAINTTTLGPGNRSINFTGLIEGTYHYNATIRDKVGLAKATETRNMTLDATDPSVYFNPQTSAAGYNSQNWISATVTATDSNLDMMIIYLYNATGSAINTTTNSASPLFVNHTSLADGTYYLNATANDTAGNDNATETRTITLDTTNPIINFSSGTESGGAFFARNWIYANTTAYDLHEANVTFRLYNSTYDQLNTTTLGPGNRSINWTGLSEGVYSYNTTITDKAGHQNSTETRNITLDIQPPSMNYESGTEGNNTYVNRNWISINVSATDINFNTLTVYAYNITGILVNSTTSGTAQLYVNYTSLADGKYLLNASANDSVGNSGSLGTLNVIIDTQSPSIDYGAGTESDGETVNVTWIYADIIASDVNEENVTFRLYNSTYSQLNETTLGPGNRSINWTSLTQGTYNYNATIRDKAGNENSTATRTISIVIDTTPPNVTFETPTTSSGFTLYDWIVANVSAEDNSVLNMISIGLYNASGWGINTTNSSSSPFFANFTGLSDGTYLLNASAVDDVFNYNHTETRSITVDTLDPTVSLSSGTEDNDSLLSRNWIYLNISAFDLNEANVTFNLYNTSGGGINKTTLGPGNRSINWTGLSSNAEYRYNATITDKAGRSNSTETRTLTLDASPVNISFEAETTTSGSKAQDWIAANISASSTSLEMIMIRLYNSTGTLVNYTQSSTSPLFANYTSLQPDTYFLNASANDTRGLWNWTETRTINLGGVMMISLESPANNSGDEDGTVSFRYSVNGAGSLSNCSLIMDGAIDQTVAAPPQGVSLNFSKSGLSSGSYSWSVNCTDGFGLEEESTTRKLDVIRLDGFSGDTTNISGVQDLSNITNFTLHKPGISKIVFTDAVNLSGGSYVASIVTTDSGWASVNSTAEPRLNRNATIEIYGLTYAYTPIVLVDGTPCLEDCIINSYLGGNLSFNVTHFSNYTAKSNSQLLIWDDTDIERMEVGEVVTFYANFSNTTNGESINGAGAACDIGFSDTGVSSMTFNPTTKLYTYQRTFTIAGYANFNVSCDATTLGYEELTLFDSAIIANDYYGPRNNHNQYYVRTTVNITDSPPEILNISCNGDEDITLNAGSTQRVQCSVIIRDYNGGNTIQYVNSTFSYFLNSSDDPDDNNIHYTNTSCTHNSTDGYNATWDCAFDVWYYANNGTWNVNVTVTDDFPFIVSSISNTTILPMYAIDVTPLIDFGEMYVGEVSSSSVQANITNYGNMEINVSVYGFGGENETKGAGLAMICNTRNITSDDERYSLNPADTWATMAAISQTPTLLPSLTMPQQEDDLTQIMNSTYWRLFINPVSNPDGICNGTVIFSAESPI
ncbi:DUF2341 domain-containing protein [Candidatus Woesearchaeota archaeon]|nr:DUF2341 domain-containing protein [Candidatus Woesearchaeota archaeon]